MTIEDLLEQLHQYPLETTLYAFDGEEEMVMPVTGMQFTPRHGSTAPTLEFQTDEQ